MQSTKELLLDQGAPPRPPQRRWGLLASICGFLVISTFLLCVVWSGAKPQQDVILWAWERPEDLRFLSASSTKAVAYFAGRITLRSDYAQFRPRVQPLQIPLAVRAFPVFRLENKAHGELLTASCERSVIDIIANYAETHGCTKLQIDFDAGLNDRAFYIDLLKQLRTKLPATCRISITSLASWCLDDPWLAKADADEAVVMLFGMENSTMPVLHELANRKLNTGKMKCAIGISLNEPGTNAELKRLKVLQRADDLYVFCSRPWTKARFREINPWRRNADRHNAPQARRINPESELAGKGGSDPAETHTAGLGIKYGAR